MPGHRLTITPTSHHIERWWNLAAVAPEPDRSEADWIEEFNAILDDAVRIRMRSDVPFGAFLSGGVDSSSVVGLMARHQSEPVKTFCIGFDDPNYDEAGFAQVAADRFRTDHLMQRVNPDLLNLWPLATYFCDQPHGDVSFLPTYMVAKLAVEHVKVVLTGDGGDELFAGYDKHKDFFSRAEVSALDSDKFFCRYFDSISLFDHASKMRLYSPGARAHLSPLESYDIARPWLEQATHQDRINQVLFLDMQLLLSGNNLVKPDRMGMAVSLEARTPFLDYRMMELAFRMPGNLKLKNGQTKYLYKRAVTPLIGKKLTYRKKQMFTVPVGEWFKSSLKGYCKHRMDRLANSSDLFDLSELKKLLSEHSFGTHNRTREIRALIALSHWFDITDNTKSEEIGEISLLNKSALAYAE